jgi:hypothetical protein
MAFPLVEPAPERPGPAEGLAKLTAGCQPALIDSVGSIALGSETLKVVEIIAIAAEAIIGAAGG